MIVNESKKMHGVVDNKDLEVTVHDSKAGKSYLKGRLLGKGGFAKCYLFRHEATKHVCAGKCVEKASLKQERARRKLLSEIKIHRALSHENVVQFEHFFEDKHYVYILLEYCNNQTLMELVKRKTRLSETVAKNFLLQLLNGVEYLHSVNVIHRDLKLGNIFLTDGFQVRIGDFGLATKLDDVNEKKKTMCGTPNYIAPEILDRKLGHSFEVDIWSIGVILYTMLVGRPPFETKHVQQTYKRIQANLYSFPRDIPLSHAAKRLIQIILNKDPAQRPSLSEIRDDCFCNSRQSPLKTTTPRSLSAKKVTSIKATPKDKENLTSMVNKSRSPPKPIEKEQERPVFVDKWVDYTTKYGLGYYLWGGIVGVCFNDSTKLVVSPNRNDFQYYERSATTYESHTLDHYPQTLHKKVTLIKHFRSYLEAKQKGKTTTPLKLSPDTQLPFVKKWVRTRHAIFFRLSNRTVQVAFFDDTQILLSAHAKKLTYFDAKQNKTTLPISEAKNHKDISKRLKYTKDVLHQLIASSCTS
uniref:Serine/threonine-protein kinase PLK n=1 Tax=Mucochytrium quahogii TaxID=96639 RepID=A0A7S2WBL4_9STRA|mmetsp:Transcript_12559/g.22804  ORF Transcript_12559/g.22804 Transcript_12559/m.22804 type:complete len:525 (+) Transcript_12559:279-1853(+)